MKAQSQELPASHFGIVAFMQNMWVREPERVKEMLARHNEEFRHEFIERALFRGCLSGRRLKSAFGSMCDVILWEETTREIGGTADSYFPPDVDHIIDIIKTYRPHIVVTFGTSAWNGVFAAQEKSSVLDHCHFVRAMHPAARHPDIMQNLKEAADQLRRLAQTDETPSLAIAREDSKKENQGH